MFNIIKYCRVCKNSIADYDLILDLGTQALTGVFPDPDQSVLRSPVTVIRCKHCGLVQLLETVNPISMFGDMYGYTSSLNNSMIKHLEVLSRYCKQICNLCDEDIILDIGSNDATFLKNFLNTPCKLIGMDPSAIKFLDKYDKMLVVTDFFSKENYYKITKNKVKLITSIACYYDLEDPIQFAQDISDILSDDGKWIIEAAYLPAIIEKNCFDGCCQEHLNYYSLNDIKNIANKVGLHIQDVSFNDTNGGSFRVTLEKNKTNTNNDLFISNILSKEKQSFELNTYFSSFTKRIISFKHEFISKLLELKSKGKTIAGLGSSTKFNVLLQYCSISNDIIEVIGEINPFKYGKVTPGTNIPIVPENEIFKYDVLIVGPYHFFESFMSNKKIIDYINKGGILIFPLPEIRIIQK